MEFPAGGDIEQQPLVVGELRHRSAQEGLGGVDHAFVPEGGNRLAATSAQMRFVVDEERCPVLLGQRLDGDPTDLEPAVVADRRRVRQQPPVDRRHICSGASMPSRSRAWARVRAVTSHSARRLDRSGSSALSTGQCS